MPLSEALLSQKCEKSKNVTTVIRSSSVPLVSLGYRSVVDIGRGLVYPLSVLELSQRDFVEIKENYVQMFH